MDCRNPPSLASVSLISRGAPATHVGPAAGVGQPGCHCYWEKRKSQGRGNPQANPTLPQALLGAGQLIAPTLQIEKQGGTQQFPGRLGLEPQPLCPSPSLWGEGGAAGTGERFL